MLAVGKSPEQERRKDKQANTKYPIYFPAQFLWESWTVDSGNNGVGGSSSHLPSGPREAAVSQALKPTLQNLCGTLPLTSPAPGACLTLKDLEARRTQFLSRVL